MARRLRINDRCPICGGHVEQVADAMLKKTPGYHDTELVVTRTGIK